MKLGRFWRAIVLASILAAGSGGAPRDTVVVVPPGASIAKAGEILEQAGATSASAFVNHARLFGGDDPIKPGEYEVKKGMSAGDILALMQAGKTIKRFVTVPEGMPSNMVWDRLMAETRLKGEISVRAAGRVLPDRKTVGAGRSVEVRVEHEGSRRMKK